MKILDSDHWIAFLRKELDISLHTLADEELAITSISIGELVYGAERSSQPIKNLLQIELLIAKSIPMPYDAESARIFGSLKRDLERRGERIDDADLHIASIALHHSVPLVTHNTRHFRRIDGLLLEDWII